MSYKIKIKKTTTELDALVAGSGLQEGLQYLNTTTGLLYLAASSNTLIRLKIATEFDYIIAANNTADILKNNADAVCTGTNDETIINDAIASLPAVGGKILLLAGEYSVGSSIIIQRDNVRIDGIGYGFWGEFSGSIPNVGTEGTGFTKIKAAADVHIIQMHDVPVELGRAEGVELSRLYLYGFGTNSTKSGIFSDSAIDQVVYYKIFIHNTLNGFDIAGDNPHIKTCTVMGVGGVGIKLNGSGNGNDNGYYPIIHDCTIADIGGDGIHSYAKWANIYGNVIVRTNRGVVIQEKESVVTNNVMTELRSIGVDLYTANNTVVGNMIKVNTEIAAGVRVIGDRNIASSNNIYLIAGTSSKPGVEVGGDYNSVVGNVTTGAFTAAVGETGTGNVVANNI